MHLCVPAHGFQPAQKNGWLPINWSHQVSSLVPKDYHLLYHLQWHLSPFAPKIFGSCRSSSIPLGDSDSAYPISRHHWAKQISSSSPLIPRKFLDSSFHLSDVHANWNLKRREKAIMFNTRRPTVWTRRPMSSHYFIHSTNVSGPPECLALFLGPWLSPFPGQYTISKGVSVGFNCQDGKWDRNTV